MNYYYDKDGREIQLYEFCKLHNDINYKRIALTEIDKKKHVSTVWLGIDHNYGDGRPLIFETIVFSDDDDNDLCERYSTLEEARAGHAAVVQNMKEKK